MRTPGKALVIAALCAACGSTTETPTTTSVKTEAVDPASCKPQPPIAIAIASRTLSEGSYEVTATATPSANVDSVDLAFVLPAGATVDRPGRAKFGATASGVARTLTAVIATPERTSEISAIARVPFEGIAMSKAATVSVGEPKVQPRTRQYATPDGELAREVRP